MCENESEGKFSRKSSIKNKNKSEAKRLKGRVEEFKLWHDDSTFTQMEYDKRRTRKKQLKSSLRNDKRLQAAKLLYIPSMCAIFVSICILLLSSIDGLATNTVLWKSKVYFQIAGGAMLGLSIVMLMAVAFYTYRREDVVRKESGFPSLFEAARTRQCSLKSMDEAYTFTCDFVERTRSSSRLSRMTSVESKTSLSNLGLSFSSASTAMSWLHKHKKEHSITCARTALRRENSDSALDTFFARNRILSWQSQTAATDTNSSEKENGGDDGGEKSLGVNPEKSNDGTNDSQGHSSVSTASSGYHSNVPSPTHREKKPTFLYSRAFSESVTEQYDDIETQTMSQEPVFSSACDDVSKALPSPMPLVPTIHIQNMETACSRVCTG